MRLSTMKKTALVLATAFSIGLAVGPGTSHSAFSATNAGYRTNGSSNHGPAGGHQTCLWAGFYACY